MQRLYLYTVISLVLQLYGAQALVARSPLRLNTPPRSSNLAVSAVPSAPIRPCQPLTAPRCSVARMDFGAVITAPIVVGLNLIGSVLKLSWRLAVAVPICAAIFQFALSPRIRVKLSGGVSAAAKVAVLVGQGLSFAVDQWHAKNVAAVGALDAARDKESVPSPKQAPVDTQKAQWTPAPASAPPSAPQPAADSLQARAARARVANPESAASEAEVRASVEAMRVRAIKEELDVLGIGHTDVVEKQDLVDRLVTAKLNPPDMAATVQPAPATAPPAPPPPPAPPSAGADPFSNPFGAGLPGPEAFDSFASQLGVDPREAEKQAEAMASDPDGLKLMEKLQNNPKVMEAIMDIAMNGEAAAEKYAADAEIMALMREMEDFGSKGGFPGFP